MRKWSYLTSTSEAAVRRALDAGGRVTTQQLLDVVLDLQDVQPEESWLETFAHNYRRDQRTNSCAPPRPAKHEWCESDWRQLERNLPKFNDIAADYNGLCIVDMCLDPAQTVVVFCNPALTHETLSRLANPKYIKLCGDGTFRSVKNPYLLCTLGVISKHYASGERDRMPAFRSTFNPVMFAVTNKESEFTYRFLMLSTKKVALKLNRMDLQTDVRQYHADWHKGEEAARAQEFPNSIRCGDWAHFTGACTRPATQRHDTDPMIQARASKYSCISVAKNRMLYEFPECEDIPTTHA